MASADDKLIEVSALEFSQRLHKELPLRHFGEFYDQEQLTEIVKMQKNNVFKMVFDKIWPREKEEIASLFKNLNRRMDKVIAEWKKKNRENEVRSVSLLQKWVDMLCENFNEALEHQVLLNPDMAVDTFKTYISSKKLTVTNVFESIWKPGTSRMQVERKSKLEKYVKEKQEEMLEKQKHNLESKSADQGKKLLGEVGAVLLERSCQLKSYVDRHQGRASNVILKGMAEEMLEYLLNGKGSSLRETHEEIHGKLVEILESEVKFLSEDVEEKMTAEKVTSYAERFDEKLRSCCVDTESGVDEAREVQEQDTQRQITMQEILNEFKIGQSFEPDDGTHGETNDNYSDGGSHVEDDEVPHMENEEETSAVAKKRIRRRLQFTKGSDSSSIEVPLSTTVTAATKAGGIRRLRESVRLKKRRKSCQAVSSEFEGRRKKVPRDSDYSMKIANNCKDVFLPVSDEDDIQIQNGSISPKPTSPEHSRKRKPDNDEMEDSPPKRRNSREVSKTTNVTKVKCPIRRSARSKNSGKKARAVVLSSRERRKAIGMKKITTKTMDGEDCGENGNDEEELSVSSPDPGQPGSTKISGKKSKVIRCPPKITLLRGDRPKYQCNVCEKRFRVSRESYLLKYHGEFCHEKNRPFTCNECGKCFIRKNNLKQHTVIHAGEKPFKCPKCPIGFKRNGNLTRHIRIHNGEKPYQCTECPMSFSMLSNLKVHLRAHARGTSFICKACNVGFVSPEALHNHSMTHKEKLSFVCNYCNERFFKMNVLKRHVMIHSGERPYQCPTCAASCTTKFNFVRHLEGVHGHPGKVAIKLANDAALDYLIRETNKQSCRDIPRDKINSAVVEYVIKKANLQLPDRNSVEYADSTSKGE